MDAYLAIYLLWQCRYTYYMCEQMFPKSKTEVLQWLGEQSSTVNNYIVPAVYLFSSLFPLFFPWENKKDYIFTSQSFID